MGVHYRSAQRWVEWYRSGGLDEVVSRRMGGVGQPRYLNSDQEERLVEEVRSGRFRTAGEIADWVQSEYGRAGSGGTAYTVCLRGWDVHRRYRGVDTRRLVEAQESWKKGALVGHFCERE